MLPHRAMVSCRFGVAILALVLMAWATRPAGAQDQTRRAPFTVHHAAIATTTLQPEVARRYAITRSAGRALLNISVLRDSTDLPGAAVPARISGAATNPNGQRQTLDVREVREGEAIYYLAEPRIAARDTLRFELTVLPEGESEPIELRFTQEFFPPVR